MITLEFTLEEVQALAAWLPVIGFQGTPEQLRGVLTMHDSIMQKVNAALSQHLAKASTQPENAMKTTNAAKAK